MPSISTDTADPNALKQIVLDYLQGKPLRVVRESLVAQTEEFHQGCKSLYEGVSLHDKARTKHDPYIEAIFLSLNIDKNGSAADQKKYNDIINRSNHLYALLKNLYEYKLTNPDPYGHPHHNKGHHHLAYLLNKIKKTTPQPWWSLYFTLGAMLSAGLGGFLYFRQDYLDAAINWCARTFPTAIDWINKTFSLLRNAPLIGLVYNVLALFWHWYYMLTGTQTPEDTLSGLIFRTINKGLIIAAYVLSYLAAGVMTGPATIFFILGSAIDVLESLYDLSTSPLATAPPRVGCELLLMENAPDPKHMGRIKVSSNAAYIRVQNDGINALYYINILNKECQLITFTTPNALNAFDIQMPSTKKSRVLGEAELNEIAHITQHTHIARKSEWGEVAAYERDKNRNERKFKAVWIKLAAALLITASVIICCVFPPNLIISLSCMVFGWLVTLAKDSIVSSINRQSDYALQKAITGIKVKKDPLLTPELAPELHALASKTQQLSEHEKTLKKLEKTLSARKRALDLKEKAVNDTLTAVSKGKNPQQALHKLSMFHSKQPSKKLGFPVHLSEDSANDDDSETSSTNSSSSSHK